MSIALLLVLFPVLLLFYTPLAWVDMAAAIMLLVHKRLAGARKVVRQPVEYDSSI
jgi:hypothetical protein